MRPTAYRRNARGLRDRQALEGVRMQAGALFTTGHSQAQVARTLGVAAAAERGIHRIRGTHHLPYSFLRRCRLFLW